MHQVKINELYNRANERERDRKWDREDGPLEQGLKWLRVASHFGYTQGSFKPFKPKGTMHLGLGSLEPRVSGLVVTRGQVQGS